MVYAARTDEQKPVPRPAHPAFRANMVDPLVRLFTATRAEGLTRGVLMGSYYTCFHRLHPEWRLPERGGTAAVSARSVAETAADAPDRGGGADLPVADENLTWRELFARMAAATGRARPVRRLPGSAVTLPAAVGGARTRLASRETGLDIAAFARLARRNLYIEPVSGRSLDAAIRETVHAG
ncbi:hypothetical protein [Catenuloplanes indicus]|uniref:Uncharacterized protein n=1 Tax=Catenuloplanes indicus TaxID=137267 RepID=A0AAE4B2K4_9ACTN|nr:hypothetical protein [Catenuloplanes indicus]MDQ0370771.1 hypothetical protein [Catenuloplanes indicus]